MINKKSNSILKTTRYKILNLKRQIKINLLKFILHNKNLSKYLKKDVYIYRFIMSKRSNNNLVCQFTGRRKSVKKQFMISRQELNRVVKSGLISNLKLKSW